MYAEEELEDVVAAQEDAVGESPRHREKPPRITVRPYQRVDAAYEKAVESMDNDAAVAGKAVGIGGTATGLVGAGNGMLSGQPEMIAGGGAVLVGGWALFMVSDMADDWRHQMDRKHRLDRERDRYALVTADDQADMAALLADSDAVWHQAWARDAFSAGLSGDEAASVYEELTTEFDDIYGGQTYQELYLAPVTGRDEEAPSHRFALITLGDGEPIHCYVGEGDLAAYEDIGASITGNQALYEEAQAHHTAYPAAPVEQEMAAEQR